MVCWKALVPAAVLFASGSLSAQVIRGSVTQRTTGAPVTDVLVTLADTAGVPIATAATSRSGPDGTFALYVQHPGSYRVRATRIGFAPAVSPIVKLSPTDIARIAVPLSPVAEQVQPVTVLEKRPLTVAELDGSDGFAFRRARFEATGEGHYLTTQDIGGLSSLNDIIGTGKAPGGHMEKIPVESINRPGDNCIDPKDAALLPANRGVNICREPTDSTWALLMPGCDKNNLPLLILDAKPVDTWESLEGRVMMSQVAGVEVYGRNNLLATSVGSVPVGSTRTSRNRAPCATIMVWTKFWFQSMDQSVKAAAP